MAAQVRDDHPVAGRRQRRSDIDIAVNVVGPAVQKNDRTTAGGAGFGISDVEHAGIDLLERAERRVRSRLDRGRINRADPARLRARRTGDAEPGERNGHGRGTQEAAAMMVDVFGQFGWTHQASPSCNDWSGRAALSEPGTISPLSSTR
jgi:hypothetical protein